MHIGNKIKEEVAKRNISVTDFAKLINKSRPYTYSIFEKENIDTSTMESEMQLSLLSALAQNEVESLST